MTRKLLIAGMPSSGKSTFIAALRYLVTSRETATVLEQTRLSDNEAHFNLLEERWIAGERVGRTQKPTEAWVTLHVRDRESSLEADISLPDLRGERFEQPAAAGLCERSLFEALLETDGLLLFTNADASDDDLMITDMCDVADALEGEAPAAEAPQPPHAVAPAGPPRFDPYAMPEQSKIVELLQMMNRRPIAPRLRQLAIIISGWDAVEVTGQSTPETWLRQNRPMLEQFIRYNPELWSPRVYGVSAQGGTLPGDKARLVAFRKPSERIQIVGHDAAAHDLTAPIRWLMTPGAA